MNIRESEKKKKTKIKQTTLSGQSRTPVCPLLRGKTIIRGMGMEGEDGGHEGAWMSVWAWSTSSREKSKTASA